MSSLNSRCGLLTVLLSSLTCAEALGGCWVAGLQRRVLHDLCSGGGVGSSLLVLALGATLAEGLFEAGQRPRRLCRERHVGAVYV
jgi:hypothetical protein